MSNDLRRIYMEGVYECVNNDSLTAKQRDNFDYYKEKYREIYQKEWNGFENDENFRSIIYEELGLWDGWKVYSAEGESGSIKMELVKEVHDLEKLIYRAMVDADKGDNIWEMNHKNITGNKDYIEADLWAVYDKNLKEMKKLTLIIKGKEYDITKYLSQREKKKLTERLKITFDVKTGKSLFKVKCEASFLGKFLKKKKENER